MTLGKLLLPGLLLLAGGIATAAVAWDGSTSRTDAARDCPGTITCPLTGERVCADRCPLDGANAEDCPGTIICPLDGEPICADRCPAQATRSTEAIPDCCAQAG